MNWTMGITQAGNQDESSEDGERLEGYPIFSVEDIFENTFYGSGWVRSRGKAERDR